MRYTVFLCTLVTLASCSSGNDPKSHARDVISICWDDYNKKSNSSSEKQFIAGACEMLEKKFVDTYGVRP